MKLFAFMISVPMLFLAGCNEDEPSRGNPGSGGAAPSGGGGTTTTSTTTTGQGGTSAGTGLGTAAVGSGTGGETSPNFNDTLTGSPCSSDAECDSFGGIKTYCKLDWSGGYCTAQCSSFSDCPRNGDDCLPVSTGSSQTICVRACNDGSICRPGYVCLLRCCFPGS